MREAKAAKKPDDQSTAGSTAKSTKRTVKEMADLAGVSARTLRYYESLGLLQPARSEADYRLYSEADAKRLVQVLAMRSCGLPLATIKRICAGSADTGSADTGSADAGSVADAKGSQGSMAPKDATTSILSTLKHHLATLENQRDSTAAAMDRTKAAIAALERMEPMTTEDSFRQMKREGLARFEEEFGQEARELYGSDAIEASNERMMALTRDEWDAKELLEEAIKVQLRLAMAAGDAASEEARELTRMHRRWIAIHWGEGYSLEAYRALVHGYLADPRFVKYYDSAAGEGATEFLVQVVDAALDQE